MGKNIKIILSIILSIIVILGAITLVKMNIAQKIERQIKKEISYFDKNAKITYNNLDVSGIFKPKQVSAENIVIKTLNYQIEFAKLTVNLISENKTNIIIENSLLKNAEQISGQTSLGYHVEITDPVEINLNALEDYRNLQFSLPQIIKFATPSATNIIKYNQEKISLDIAMDNDGYLKSFNYKDQGLSIYSKEDLTEASIISTSGENIIEIDRKDEAKKYIYDITVKSSDNNMVNTSIKFGAEIFDLKFIALFEKNKLGENFETKLDLNSFALNFPKFNISLEGKMAQNAQNFVPFGQLKFQFSNYKEFTKIFYDNLKENSHQDESLESFFALQNESYFENLLKFLETLNGNESTLFELNIIRGAAQLPYINNLEIEEIVALYQEIITTDSE